MERKYMARNDQNSTKFLHQSQEQVLSILVLKQEETWTADTALRYGMLTTQPGKKLGFRWCDAKRVTAYAAKSFVECF